MWPFSSRKYQSRTPNQRRRCASRLRLEVLEDRCLLSAGALDPTFGSGAGYVTTTLSGSSSDTARQILVQPSGDLVVAGRTTIPITTTTKHGTTTTNAGAFGVVEYNPDGSLNTAFGSGGIVRQPFAGSTGSSLQGAALESMGTTGDSKILLVGAAGSGQYGLALMRLNANGTLDTTFGNNGQVITPIPTSSTNLSGEIAESVAVTSSGQILVIGVDNGSNSVLLARYNPNGTLDTTFGTGGTATTAFSSRISILSMALQSDGKCVIVGAYQTGTNANGSVDAGLVLRYNASGSLDTTFGNGGIVTTAINVGASPSTGYNGVAVYPNAGAANDGKIIVAGTLTNTPGAPQNEERYVAVRYNPNGSLDSTFGGETGYEVINDPKYTYPKEMPHAIAIESDGKPILAGIFFQPGTPADYSQVVRLNADGSLDTTFGSGGFVFTAIGTAPPTAGTGSGFWAVAIQPDGKIDAAGFAVVGGGTQYDFTLARYLASDPQIGSFTANPNPVMAGSSVTLTASNITDGNPNSTITQVTFYYYDINGNKVVLGYGTADGSGDWILNFTVNLTSGTYTLYAQAQDNYGVLGDPDALTLTVQ